jgi:hypothetical protein
VVTVTRRSGRTVSSTARPPPDARADTAADTRTPNASARRTLQRQARPPTTEAAATRTGGSHRVPAAATTVAPANVSRLDAGEVSVASPATAAGPATPDTP